MAETIGLRADLGDSLAKLKEPRWLVPIFMPLSSFLFLAAGSGVAVGISKGERNTAGWGIFVFVGAVSAIGFLSALAGIVYLLRRRDDCTEVFSDGFCQVRCGVDSCYRWDDVLYCTTFEAVDLGQKLPFLQVALKN